MCVCVCVCVTYTLDGVGAGGPNQHGDSVVLLVGVHLQSHLIGGHAEGGDHLTDAAGERVPEGDSDITADIIHQLVISNRADHHLHLQRLMVQVLVQTDSLQSCWLLCVAAQELIRSMFSLLACQQALIISKQSPAEADDVISSAGVWSQTH